MQFSMTQVNCRHCKIWKAAELPTSESIILSLTSIWHDFGWKFIFSFFNVKKGEHFIASINFVIFPGEHTDHKAAISWFPNWHSDPIQNAHILPLAITARYQFYTLAWSSHLAQGCYMVSQPAALRFEPTTSAFRVPCAIHSATTSPQGIYTQVCRNPITSIYKLYLSDTKHPLFT